MSDDLVERLARCEAEIARLCDLLTPTIAPARRGAPKIWISATAADDAVGWRHGETKRRIQAGLLIGRSKVSRGPGGKAWYVRKMDVIAEAERAP